MGAPKEDQADKQARLRERRLTEIDRMALAEKNAAGLFSDLRAVYGVKSLSGFGAAGTAMSAPAAPRPTGKRP